MNERKGFTLIEFMVGMLLGSLIIGSFLHFLSSQMYMAGYIEQQIKAQSHSREAMNLLTNDILIAGSGNPLYGLSVTPIYTGVCGGFANCTSDGGGVISDAIAFQFDPAENVDCTGDFVVGDDVIINRYYVDTATSLPGADFIGLFCQAFDSTGVQRSDPLLLVPGIDNLQILYGVAGPGVGVRRYLTASAVVDWNRVRSVQVAFLANSGESIGRADLRSRTFNLLGSGDITFTDRFPRYVMTTVRRIFITEEDLYGAVIWWD